MRKDIKKLLGLQHAWIDSWEIKERRLTVKIRSPRTSACCLACGRSSKKIHQYHRRMIKHSIWQSRLVILDLTKRRFYCRRCHKPFSETMPGINQKQSTENFRNVLLKDLAFSSLSRIKEKTNVSSSVLYSVLRENHSKVEAIDWEKMEKNITLGVDEHSFRGRRLVLTFTNITEKKLLGIGTDDRLATLEDFLRKADKSRVAEVCIDMKAGYLYAIKRILPQASITVDKFHVVAYANRLLDEVRSVVLGNGNFRVKDVLFKGREKLNERQKIKLENLFDRYGGWPSLKQAYFIKEKIRDFYQIKDKPIAERKLNDIIMFCETCDSRYLIGLAKTLKRWRPYILNYFNRYSTNAFTEGVHTKIKMIKRVSFGFRNINNYIAKMTLAFMPILWLIHHTN